MTGEAPVVATFIKDITAGWPEVQARQGERQLVAPRVQLMSLMDVFTTTHTDDRHFVAYADPNRLSMRLNTTLFNNAVREAALARRQLSPQTRAWAMSATYTVDMVAFVVDVDDPIAHAQGTPARDEWRAAEHQKVAALLQAHPGGFVYQTRGGHRLVYSISPYRLASDEDYRGPNGWRKRYKLVAASLLRRFGIVPDPSCSDWTRCFRAPHVVRDGKIEQRPIYGDPRAIGMFMYEPTEADIATARELAKSDGRWHVDGDERQYAPRPPTSSGGSISTEGGDEGIWLDEMSWNLDDPAVRAAIDLLVEHFPERGCRHDLSMAFAGWLRRSGATEEDAYEILFEIFERGGSDKAHTRASIVRNTWSLPTGAPMRGYTFAASLIGEDVVKKAGNLFLTAYNNAFLSGWTFARQSPKLPAPGSTAATILPAPVVLAIAPPATPAKEITAKMLRAKLRKLLRAKSKKLEKLAQPATEKQRRAHAWLRFDVIMLGRLLDHAFLDDRAGDGWTIGDPKNAAARAMNLVGGCVPVGTSIMCSAIQELLGNALIRTLGSDWPLLLDAEFKSAMVSGHTRTKKWKKKTQAARDFNSERNRRLFGDRSGRR